jgi:hypothetical protein
MGGPKFGIIGSKIYSNYTLKRHSYLKLSFSFIRFGNWNSVNNFIINLDENKIYSINNFTSPQLSPFCFK